EIDAWQFSTHNFQRFKTRRATFLGSPTAKASPSGVATTSHPQSPVPSPQSPVPSPQLLPLADLLTTFSSVRCVLSLFSAFGDDDLELVHVRGRRRAAGLPVQRRAGRKILLVGRPQLRPRRVLRRHGGPPAGEHLARADGELVVVRGVHGPRLARLSARGTARRLSFQDFAVALDDVVQAP